MMIQEAATVLWNESMGHPYYRIGLTCSEDYKRARPGQFVMVHLMDSHVSLLRRPFSIHGRIIEQERIKGIEILYKVVGPCTERLTRLGKDDRLDLLGPLGSGFRISTDYSRVYLVSGGIGVAPMAFLAAALVEAGIEPGGCHVFLGGRSKEDLLCEDIFSALGMGISINTDDGSAGDACLVTDPLEKAVREDRPDVIYACGPMEMLKCVSDIAETHSVACQVSIETRMACGMGACLGCAVESREDKDAFLHACVDGPVFDGTTLAF
jgi:dihydroorotate dehydrogenase electron transfer subunit